jgi:hypothetical protein
MMAGGFTVLIPLKNKQTSWKLSIRFTVISWEAQPRKPARCIFAAEVLRDQRHVAEIFKLGNPQAKMDYLETQKITASI